MPGNTDTSSTPADTCRFATTHWSVVLAAGKNSSANQKQALETLCQRYWFPLYAFLRRRGNDTHQAEDFTQAFFTQLLEKHDLRAADPKYGKFHDEATIKGVLMELAKGVQAGKVESEFLSAMAKKSEEVTGYNILEMMKRMA